MSNWVRTKGEKPVTRQVVLRYKTADPSHAIIEELLECIPYGKGNEVLLECIRMAAPVMLDALRGKQAPLEVVTPRVPDPSAGTAAAPSPAAACVPPSAPPGFSPQAQALFDMGDPKRS